MKKVSNFIIFTVMCLFIFVPFVYAENEEETNSSCDIIEFNNLKKEAANVIGTYEFVYDENGQVKGFNYLIFNIPDNMFVSYKDFNVVPGEEAGTYETVIKYVDVDPETGVGKVFDSNISDTYKINFFVQSQNGKCSNALKTISIEKPRYNELSETEDCNQYEVQDYIYCQAWVTQDFPLTYNEIIQRIKDKKEKEKDKTTIACVYCEENEKNNKIYNMLVAIRKYAIYGVSAGIIIDIFVIIFLSKRIKENRIL